eukprot:134425-Chlamydomonas_euryale.AAC.1
MDSAWNRHGTGMEQAWNTPTLTSPAPHSSPSRRAQDTGKESELLPEKKCLNRLKAARQASETLPEKRLK